MTESTAGEASDLPMHERIARLHKDLQDKAKTPLGSACALGVPFVRMALARRVVEGLGGHELALVQANVLGSIELLEAEHVKDFVVRISPVADELSAVLPKLPTLDPAAVDRFLTEHRHSIAKLCAMGPMHGRLQKDLAARAIRSVSDIDAIAAFLRSASLVTLEVPSEEFARCAPHL